MNCLISVLMMYLIIATNNVFCRPIELLLAASARKDTVDRRARKNTHCYVKSIRVSMACAMIRREQVRNAH